VSNTTHPPLDHDWIVVVSGFGGSVAALRLAENRVAVIERGREYADEDLPRSASDNTATGVIDAELKVFGYRNLVACDAAALPASPGVNPALTITALAEHAMAQVPAAGLKR
jgi:choline dehydrogenase-like flavoprotein